MAERYCLILDQKRDSATPIFEMLKSSKLFSNLDVVSDTDTIREMLKKRAISSSADENSLIIAGPDIEGSSLKDFVSYFSRSASPRLKVLLIRSSNSLQAELPENSHIDTINVGDNDYSTLVSRIRLIVTEMEKMLSSQEAASLAQIHTEKNEQKNSDNPFSSASFAFQLMKTIQRLEILLWSQGGAKLEDKILPRFVIGKLARELLEPYTNDNSITEFRKHFESSVMEWNRSLKKNSIEKSRHQLIYNLLSFRAFDPQIRATFSKIPGSSATMSVAENQNLPAEVSEQDSSESPTESLVTTIGQGFSKLDDLWNELWGDIEMSDMSAEAEALLEQRVRKFVIKLFGSLPENDLIREFRLYFEKHLMQWYKDARTMPQEQASAVLRRRIMAFPGLSTNVLEQDQDESENATSIAEVMTHIVNAFGELVPLFSQGAFALSDEGKPTEQTHKTVEEFVGVIFAAAPKTIKIAEFRSHLADTILSWAVVANKEGFETANLSLKQKLQAFYQKI